MPTATDYRVQLKTEISRLLKGRRSDSLFVYITGDKRPVENFATQVHPEVLPLFYKQLVELKKVKKISLLLYTTGGALETPWGLVNLIREYCDTFEVLVPYKAFSAGTLICLGADVIGTTPLTFLGPVDPQGNFVVQNQRRTIQVEDVAGFIDFAKNKVGLRTQESLVEILKALVIDTPPQFLGNINRTHSLIRLLVDKMVALHKKPIPEKQKDQIKEALTEKLYSHQHLINRKELLRLGFRGIIEELPKEQEEDLMKIFYHFATKMELFEEFDPEVKLTSGNTEIELPRAIISSEKQSQVFLSKYTIQRQDAPQGQQTFFLNVKDMGWQKMVI